MKNKKKSLWWKILLAVLVVCIGTFLWYVNDYYHADYEAMDQMSIGENVITTQKDGLLVAEPEGEIKAGLVFYPGGKVEYTAYRELMEAFAEEGILAITVKMPFHLAIFDGNAAEGIQEMYPEIETWYIGGHSLGGVMAASYVEKHPEEFDGLMLLGSYSTADLSDLDMEGCSVTGTLDTVIDWQKQQEHAENIPFAYPIGIVGGNHAYYGVYGEQEGDGTATISNEEQIRRTVEAVLPHILY